MGSFSICVFLFVCGRTIFYVKLLTNDHGVWWICLFHFFEEKSTFSLEIQVNFYDKSIQFQYPNTWKVLYKQYFECVVYTRQKNNTKSSFFTSTHILITFTRRIIRQDSCHAIMHFIFGSTYRFFIVTLQCLCLYIRQDTFIHTNIIFAFLVFPYFYYYYYYEKCWLVPCIVYSSLCCIIFMYYVSKKRMYIHVKEKEEKNCNFLLFL